MHDWQTLIDAASRAGYLVKRGEEGDGWSVITPKAPRKPSQELGSFESERAAWRAAAFYATQ